MMYDYKKMLVYEGEKANTLSLELKQKYENNSKKIYVVVEGKDDRIYYANFIRNYLSGHEDWDEPIFVLAKKNDENDKEACKQKVIQCYNSINWDKYNKNQIVFCVDRDLSIFTKEKIPNEKNFYITDGYSIENNVFQENILMRVLNELCDFEYCEEDEIKKLRKMYANAFNYFYNQMCIIMAWILYWQKENIKAYFNNIDIGKIFNFCNGNIETNENCNNEYFLKKSKVKCDCSCDLSSYINTFKEKDSNKMFVRGKYLEKFFIEFCLCINNDYKNIRNICLKKTSNIDESIVRRQLSFRNIACITAIPKSLEKLLDNTIKVYIDNFELIHSVI